MLDEALDQRLEIFAATDGMHPTVIPFVRAELEALDIPDERRTDTVLGMLTSHLIGALQRALQGEALTAFSAEEVIDQAIAERPEALTKARGLTERVQDKLDIQLPETETRILALHFATL